MAQERSRRFGLLLLLLFAGAVAVRVFGLNWDQGHNYHPDERRIVEAVHQLSFSPPQFDPKFYAYGSLPFYVTRAAASLLGNASPWFTSWDGILLTDRVLSALWGAAACVLLALLGRRLFGERAGLLSGVFLAIAVFPVQNSHFGTNDIPLATLVTATFLLLARALDRETPGAFALAGVAAGFALATKASAMTLLLPLALAPLFLFLRTRRVSRALAAAAATGFGFVAAFLAGQPTAVFAARELLAGVAEQGRMVRHAGSLPYTNQYVGVPKVLYDLSEIVLWGLGPALGLAALAGVAARIRPLWKERDPRELLLWAWAVPFFAVTASFDVKFPRYLLPLYPLLLLAAGALLARRDGEGGGRRFVRRVVLGLSGDVPARLPVDLHATPHHRHRVEVVPRERRAGRDGPHPALGRGLPLHLPRPPGREVPSRSSCRSTSRTIPRRRAFSRTASPPETSSSSRRRGSTARSRRRKPATPTPTGSSGSSSPATSATRSSGRSPPRPSCSACAFRASSPTSRSPSTTTRRRWSSATRNGSRPRRSRAACGARPSKTLSRSDLLLARPDDPHADSGERIGGTRSTPLALLLWAALLQAFGLAAWRLLGSRLPAAPGVYALAKVAGVALFGAAAWGLVSWGPFTFVPSFAFAVALGVIVLGRPPGADAARDSARASS